MRAKSIHGKTPEEIQIALTRCMTGENQGNEKAFKPTLAFVFLSIKQDREAVCDLLRKENIDIVGATSSGLFTDGYQEGYEEEQGSTVILLLDISREAYTIHFENLHDTELKKAAHQIATMAKQKFAQPAFIVCSTGLTESGELFDGPGFIGSMKNELGSDIKLFGGCAGDDLSFTGTYVFDGQHSSNHGIVTLILDENRIELTGMAISGWNPIGISRTVTRSEGDLLYEIDGKSALEMYLKYLGMDPVDEDDKHKMFEEIGIHYPFQVESADDPVMRTPFLVDNEKGALKMDYGIPAGTKFRFSVPPDFNIAGEILEKARELRNFHQGEADALLIFSCAGRLNALGPMTELENEGLKDIWSARMAGFFTYGEYGTSPEKGPKCCSTTVSWVALKEKKG